MSKVMLDPGHGGKDPGAVGPTGLKEKDVTLDISKRVGSLLAANGVTISYSRTGDTFLSLSSIAAAANNWKADYFVSIHCNAFTSRAVNGTETFYYPGSSKGKTLASCIQVELVNALKLIDRGVKTAKFVVLEETKMPAVLTEVAFISNPEEEKKLADPAFRQKAAEGIARGICKHLGISYKAPTQIGKLYKVQVGAFSKRENAESLLQKLKKAGFDGFIKIE